MSNQQVGAVYQNIIADVVESSRVDFEEGGVDEHVLEELRMGWQQKLSQLQVATFPWDPKPEPQAPVVQPPTVPSNASNYMNTPPLNPPQSGLTMPQINSGGQGPGPRIKNEPGVDDHPNFPPTHMAPPHNAPQPHQTAQQRAAQHLQNSYGPRAERSINAIQGGLAGGAGQGAPQQGVPNPQMQQQMHNQMQQQQQQQQHLHMQMQAQQRAASQGAPQGGIAQQQQHQQNIQRPQMTQEQYRNAMAQDVAKRHQALQSRGPGQNGLGGAQNDGGADEYEEGVGIIKKFDASGNEVAMGRVEIDGLIRSRIEAMGQAMEGGGLMLPLEKASTPSKRQRKNKKSSITAPGGVDGGDDDDEIKDGLKDDDEDAINSDLDDPDDLNNEDEDEDEALGHIMLCMYDKVQRVKNKWKCVMKDGVLTVNGKEYVFHKATGEYEW